MDGVSWADEHLLVAKAVTDPTAFADIYDHYFSRVYNYVRCRIRDAPTTDDLTARIFERVLTKLDSYQPERAPFGAWLFAVARHEISNYYRARRLWLPFENLRHIADRSPSPEENAINGETHEALLEALAHLKERDRDLIALKFVAGLNNRQIAKLTHLSESNVSVILCRAMQHLRTVLEENDHA